MMNPGRYDGGYVAGGEAVPQSPNTTVSQYVTEAQHEAAFVGRTMTPVASATDVAHAPAETHTREELEARSQREAPRQVANPGFTPGFYVGFQGPDPPPRETNPGTGSPAYAGAVLTTAEEAEPSLEEIVNKVVIHTHKPIENLPTISPPELKIIGRAVTFRGETKVGEDIVMMHYEGLVSTINKDTVMLIHVHRFTEDDFRLHQLEVTEMKEADEKDEKAHAQRQNADGYHNQQPAATEEEATAAVEAATSPRVRAPREELEQSPQSAPAPSPPISEADGLDMGHGRGTWTPMPVLPNAMSGGDHKELNQRVRTRLRNHTGSMGPIPFMTFSRTHIHEVQFARDPRSDFYSLFQDPTKRFFDMQCLRMFCRRYIVHTAQGNNPRQIPLRAFVTCRCSCPELDNDLLHAVTKEEIEHLVKVHREVQRAKKRKETGRRNVLRMYRAPAGLFRNTGVLYLTQIPKQTLVLGVLEVVMTVVVGLYAAISLSTTPAGFVRNYVNGHVPFILPGIIFGSMSGFFTIVHAVRMSLPFSRHIFLTAGRLLVVTCAIACNLMTMIAIGQSFKVQKVRDAFNDYGFRGQCYFYEKNMCLGFDSITCPHYVGAGDNSVDVCSCARTTNAGPCKYIVMGSIERTMIPVVCFTLVLFILLWFDHFLHYKLFYVGRLLMQRM